MKHRELARQKQSLDNLFRKISAIPEDEGELRSHWARYLCILVSGFIEEAIRTIYTDYARSKAAPAVGNYVSAQLGSFTNAKMEKIFSLIGQFDVTWQSKLRNALDDELKDAIDSVVARRHEIAHGRGSGITFHNIRSYYERVVRAIEIIESECV